MLRDGGSMTEQDALSVMRYMAAAWPRAEVTPETVAIYVMHMLRSRLAADVLLLAAMRLVETSIFWPSVAELLAQARQIEAQRAGYVLTSNWRVWGERLPEDLALPAGLARQWLGYEPLALEAGDS